MKELTLKICPWCRQVPAWLKYRDPTMWRVACRAKECVVNPQTILFYDQEDAANFWNHRRQGKPWKTQSR